jgi:hypothetical protein
MVVSLVVLSILAQDVAPPPPPPPLVPASPPLAREPVLPQDAVPPPPAPPGEEARTQEGPPAGTRIVGSIGAGVLGAAATTGLLVYVGSQRCSTNGCGTGNGYLGLASVLVGAAVIALGAWGAHRLIGGKSSVGWALLGTVAGAAVGFFGTLFIDTFVNASNPRSVGLSFPFWGYVVVSTGLAAVGAGTMPEIGNFLQVRQEQSNGK